MSLFRSAVTFGGNTAVGIGVGALSGAITAGEGNRFKGALAGGAIGAFGGVGARVGAGALRKPMTKAFAKNMDSRNTSLLQSYAGSNKNFVMPGSAGGRRNAVSRIASGNGEFASRAQRANQLTSRTRRALSSFHNPKSRNAIFRSGAMLGGAAFGAMFAGEGRSHARGFNSRRGNGFGR